MTRDTPLDDGAADPVIANGQYEDYQAVIVDFWINNAWRFYLQRYRIDFQNAPHTHQLRDVAALN